MEWNEDVISRLRDLWTEGHSTAEIGRRLGVSKNAIVGKAHRLDLAGRPSPIRREGSDVSAERRAVPRRMDGPTLPPLASTGAPAVVALPAAAIPLPDPVLAAVPAPVPVPVPVSVSVSVPVLAPVSVSVPVSVPGSVSVSVSVQPKPAPPRPVQMPPPRLQPVAARPYGRIVTCCWPIGEPGTKTFRFCDDRSEPGKPYCEDHAKLAYVKVRDRREDAA